MPVQVRRQQERVAAVAKSKAKEKTSTVEFADADVKKASDGDGQADNEDASGSELIGSKLTDVASDSHMSSNKLSIFGKLGNSIAADDELDFDSNSALFRPPGIQEHLLSNNSENLNGKAPRDSFLATSSIDRDEDCDLAMFFDQADHDRRKKGLASKFRTNTKMLDTWVKKVENLARKHGQNDVNRESTGKDDSGSPSRPESERRPSATNLTQPPQRGSMSPGLALKSTTMKSKKKESRLPPQKERTQDGSPALASEVGQGIGFENTGQGLSYREFAEAIIEGEAGMDRMAAHTSTIRGSRVSSSRTALAEGQEAALRLSVRKEIERNHLKFALPCPESILSVANCTPPSRHAHSAPQSARSSTPLQWISVGCASSPPPPSPTPMYPIEESRPSSCATDATLSTRAPSSPTPESSRAPTPMMHIEENRPGSCVPSECSDQLFVPGANAPRPSSAVGSTGKIKVEEQITVAGFRGGRPAYITYDHGTKPHGVCVANPPQRSAHFHKLTDDRKAFLESSVDLQRRRIQTEKLAKSRLWLRREGAAFRDAHQGRSPEQEDIHQDKLDAKYIVDLKAEDAQLKETTGIIRHRTGWEAEGNADGNVVYSEMPARKPARHREGGLHRPLGGPADDESERFATAPLHCQAEVFTDHLWYDIFKTKKKIREAAPPVRSVAHALKMRKRAEAAATAARRRHEQEQTEREEALLEAEKAANDALYMKYREHPELFIDSGEARLLHHARAGNLRALVGSNAHVDARWPSLRAAFLAAAREGRADVLNYFLEKTPCQPMWTEAGTGSTALHLAAKGNHVMCCYVLQKGRVDINAKDYEGRTALDVAGPAVKDSFQRNGRFAPPSNQPTPRASLEDKAKALRGKERQTSSFVNSNSTPGNAQLAESGSCCSGEGEAAVDNIGAVFNEAQTESMSKLSHVESMSLSVSLKTEPSHPSATDGDENLDGWDQWMDSMQHKREQKEEAGTRGSISPLKSTVEEVAVSPRKRRMSYLEILNDESNKVN